MVDSNDLRQELNNQSENDFNQHIDNNINNNNDNNHEHELISIENSKIEFKKLETHLEMESTQMRLDNPALDLELGQAANKSSIYGVEDFKLQQYFEDSQRQAKENGSKSKRLGLSIHNLTVVGRGADVSIIPDMLTPIKFFFNLFNPLYYINKQKHEGTKFNILNNLNLFCKSGEMLLVLGKPGAGCSTLLRVISNQREGYLSVQGDVNYGGLDATSKDWINKYRGQSLYTPEEDSHYATLTVRETLDFTLKCKTPGDRLPEESKREFRKKIFDLLLKMFGITKQADTMVGSEYIPGLSGGERKRLTIVEAMINSSPINCWDCATRGLDAASALDYAKSLRIMSDTLDKTTIASFYQASDSIYNLFDKVLVMEKGKPIYFGPIESAKQYFIDLGFECESRKSTPDFLTSVTNPQERKVRAGFEDRVPVTSDDFQQCWLQSPLYQVSMEQQRQFDQSIQEDKPYIEFEEQVGKEKSRTTPQSRPYTTSFATQVYALIKRQFQIIRGDKLGLFSRYFSVLTQSFLYGSLFFQLQKDMDGLFTRGGALFGSLMFNAFISQGELGGTFMGRRTLQKHSSYALYRPSAFHVAQVITDIPITILQVLLFGFVAYWMFGLQYRADQFFIFCFVLLGITLCLTNLFRMFGNFSPSLYVSQNVSSVFILFMFAYGGYLIPYDKQYPWFQWFTWIDPFAYGMKALLINEFLGMEFDCSSVSIPYGDSYKDNNYRICPSLGTTQGDMILTGEQYLEETLSIPATSGHRALNVIVLYLWWVLYTILNMYALEKFDWTSGGYTHKVYKPGKAPKINDSNDEKAQIEMVNQATNQMNSTLKMYGGTFSWQNICYTVPLPNKGSKLLLDNVQGWIKPGQMTALVGSSGAGKSTLLDVLAKRKTLGQVQGTTLLNGKPLDIDFERITGYVEQMDVFNPHLTIRETLQFSAKMRQDPSVSIAEKYQYVEEVLKMMEMAHLGDALIGSLENGIGISVEERKRLNIGVELVAKPHILFLDEPTSGLDAQSSYNIVKFIRKLADAGMPLICTIHQPSSELFQQFDRILLLGKGGKTIYFGDIGENSSTLTDYFVRNGVRPIRESENAAEYILEAIGAGVHGSTDKDWSMVWNQSNEYQTVTNQFNDKSTLHDQSLEIRDDREAHQTPREFATSFFYQIWEVYKRLNLVWWRDPYYSFGRFWNAIFTGIVVGFSFWNLKDSSSDMHSRVFVIFQALFLSVMLIFIAMPQFFIQRLYFRRDYSSKFYSWFPFAFSIVIVEVPYIIVTGTIFFFCAYWTSGLDYDAESGIFFYLMFNAFNLFCVSFGQIIAAISFSMFLAMTVAPLLIVFLFLFVGIMVPYKTMPTFWRSWVPHVNPAGYYIESMITNVLKDVVVKCSDKDLVKFNPPPGQTCLDYTNQFLQYATGYIDNPSDTSDCGYCVYSSGKEYYETVLDWTADTRWRNLAIVIGFWLFNIVLVGIFVYLTRKQIR